MISIETYKIMLREKEEENVVLKDKIAGLTSGIKTYRNQVEAVYLVLRAMVVKLEKAGTIEPSVNFTEWKEARV